MWLPVLRHLISLDDLGGDDGKREDPLTDRESSEQFKVNPS